MFRALLLSLSVGGLVLLAGSANAKKPLAPNQPIETAIDGAINATLKEWNVTAAPQASEANLVRRLTLDLAGRTPTAIEVREYVDSTDADKRVQLVDRLMKSEEFADQMADRFDFMLMADTGASLRDYLKPAFVENRPWNQIFRELLLPKQKTDDDRKVAEFVRRRANDTDKLTVDVSSIFFGVNVSCAQCHDHPEVIEWSQDHYYGMKSFFNRTFDNGGFVAERETGLVKFTPLDSEEKTATLMFLSGAELKEPAVEDPSKEEQKKIDEQFKKLVKEKKAPPAPKYSRRARLLDVALSEDGEPFFARSIVNRLWYQFFGYGLVMPLDQMHNANPSQHEELLNWLAKDLASHDYNLRRLVRGLTLSEAYSRTSLWENDTRPNQDLIAVANVRPLTPRQLARSLSLAAADTTSIGGSMSLDERQKKIASMANTGNEREFQQPRVNHQVTANEALFFSNSEQFQKSYLAGGLFRHLKEMTDADEMIKVAIWQTLGREPEDEECKLFAEYLDARSDHRDEACQQVIWALLSSSEFRFNY